VKANDITDDNQSDILLTFTISGEPLSYQHTFHQINLISIFQFWTPSSLGHHARRTWWTTDDGFTVGTHNRVITLGLHHTTWKSMAWATVPARAAINSWPGPGALFNSTALQRRSVVAIVSPWPSLICCNCYKFLMTTFSLVKFIQCDTVTLTNCSM